MLINSLNHNLGLGGWKFNYVIRCPFEKETLQDQGFLSNVVELIIIVVHRNRSYPHFNTPALHNFITLKCFNQANS